MATAASFSTELYVDQKNQFWPVTGNHILAQFDDESVIVYQAYKPSIAKYAVQHQRFGGDFSFDRMSWIKTNFLWMMYRCGWCSKRNQEHVLAVRIKREGFEEILANAYSVKFQKSQNVMTHDINVRLQWDPDHSPTYAKQERRAIQLGLKGEVLRKYATEWVMEIYDITNFVQHQKWVLDQPGGIDRLLVASERVYRVTNPDIVSRIGLDEDTENTNS